MGAIANAFNSFSNAAYGVASGVENELEKQARIDINNRQLKLQEDINAKLNSFNTRSDYENWSQEVDDLFTKTTANMSNRASDYYCRNNLTARMFNEVLENARLQTQQKTTLLVQQFNSKKNWTDFGKTIDRIYEMYSGQDAFDQSVIALNDLKGVESVDPMREDELKTSFWQRAVSGVYENTYAELKDSALAAGKTAEEVWNDIDRVSKDTVTRKDNNGIAIPNYGSGEYKKNLKKNFIQQYGAEQAQYQRNNAEVFSNDIVNKRGDVMDLLINSPNAKSIDKVVAEITISHNRLERTQPGQLGNGVKDSLSKEYKSLLDLVNGINTAKTSGSGKKLAAALYKDADAERAIDYFLNAFERGDESILGGTASVYDTWEAFRDYVVKDAQEITGDTTLSWNDVERMAPKVGTFLKAVEKRLPPEYKAVIATAENLITSVYNTKENPKGAEAVLPEAMDLLLDTLFEVNNSDLDSVERQKIADTTLLRFNSLYGLHLENTKQYKALAKETGFKSGYLQDYKEVIGPRKESNMAQAMQERDNNPDLIYKDKNGVIKRAGSKEMQQGLVSLENDERNMLKDTLLKQYGIEIDPAKIKADYEADGVYDVTARNVYHVNGKDYRFHSEDGKTVILEEKDTGNTNWHELRTAKQQEKYESPRQVKKRAEAEINNKAIEILKNKTISSVPDVDYYELKDNNGDRVKLTFKLFNSLSEDKKRKVLHDLLSQYPEETEAWLKTLIDKK